MLVLLALVLALVLTVVLVLILAVVLIILAVVLILLVLVLVLIMMRLLCGGQRKLGHALVRHHFYYTRELFSAGASGAYLQQHVLHMQCSRNTPVSPPQDAQPTVRAYSEP